MARANFTRLQTKGSEGGSDVLDRQIQHVQNAFEKLGDVVNNDRIQTVTFKAGVPVTVGHGLGAPVKFYDVSMHSAPARISLAPTQPVDPRTAISLVSDADVTVTLRFS